MRSTLCAASRTLTGILFVLICSNLAWADASSWLTAVSGNWSDATKWDNGLPNNGTTLYDAIIAAAGASPYTVTMKSAATVNSFTLNSPQATLDITTGGTLSLAGPAPSQLWAGVLKFSGGTLKGGQLDLHGNSITATATGGTLDGVNVLGDFNLTGKSGKLTVANGTTFQGSNITVTDATLTINQDAVWNDKAVTMQSVSSGPGISVASSRTLTLGPATVVTSNGFTIIWSMLDSTVITQGKISGQAVELGSFTNSGQIQGGSMYLGYSGCQWVNAASGVISCDSALAPAGRLPAFDLAGTWRNDGLMTFANFTFGDGDLAFQGTGTNAGTMSFSGCFVSFPSAVSRTPKVRNTGTMTFTNCDITGAPTLEGNFSITGGTWQFTQDDRIDNTGHVLNLGGGAKVTALNYSSGYGAGIKGGTIKVVGGVQLSGSLDGVTIEGDVTIPDRKTLNLYESGTAPSVIHGNVNMTRGELGYTIIAPGGSLTFANTYTFPTSPWSSSYVLTNMAVIDSGVPAGVTLTGSGSACIHANLDISNKGTITLNQPNTTLWIWNDWDPWGPGMGLTSTTNEGVINLSSGAILYGSRQITNTGSVDVQGIMSDLTCSTYVQTSGVTHIGAHSYLDAVSNCDFQGGRLEGAGSIAAWHTSLVLGNVDVCPGDALGAMEMYAYGSILFGTESRLDVDLGDPSNSDLLDLGTTKLTTLQGSINVTAWPGFGVGRYVIIKGKSTSVITDDGMRVGTMPDGFSATLDFSVPGEVGLMVVPEPATALLLVAGVLLGRVRRARVAR